jgi:uncharacterized protein YjbJ (UPF0337 family)
MGDSIPEHLDSSSGGDQGKTGAGTHFHMEDAERRQRRGVVWVKSKTNNGVPLMDREHIKGAADKAKGAIKDTAGKMTGDKELQSEGKVDKAKGGMHNAVGDVKDAFRNQSK